MPPTCVPEEDDSCSLCGDEGLVAEVLEAPGRGGRGRVRMSRPGGTREERRIAFDLLPDVKPGDRVVVHMGFAIGRVREARSAARGG